MSYPDFEIENHVLIRYHGRGNCVAVPKKLTHVIIPEGVTEIGEKAFAVCNGIRSAEIPEGVRNISYYAVNFWNDSQTEQIIFPESMEQLVGQSVNQTETLKSITWHQIQFFLDENIEWTHAVIYIRIVRDFLQNPDHETYQNNLKRNIEPVILYLEDSAFQKILDSGKIFNSQNIDDYIQYAIDYQKYSRQILLTNYQYQHCDFQSPCDKLKL